MLQALNFTQFFPSMTKISIKSGLSLTLDAQVLQPARMTTFLGRLISSMQKTLMTSFTGFWFLEVRTENSLLSTLTDFL